MTQNLSATLTSQFRAENPSNGTLRRLFSRFFGGKHSGLSDRSRRAPQPDGLAVLEQEVNRIRLQSRHWLM